MSITLSTHVLDSVTGTPAAGMAVRLEVAVDGRWPALGAGVTDPDGRLRAWGDAPLQQGNHRLRFDTGSWFAARGRACFYPEVVITFAVEGDGHFHVPLLLAPYAYSTYRGS